MNKLYTFKANEGFQAIMLELIGKNSISSADYDKLIRELQILENEKALLIEEDQMIQQAIDDFEQKQ